MDLKASIWKEKTVTADDKMLIELDQKKKKATKSIVNAFRLMADLRNVHL